MESLLFYLQATKALGSGGSELSQMPQWVLSLQVGDVSCLFGGSAYLGLFLVKMFIPIGMIATFAILGAIAVLVQWLRRSVRRNGARVDELQVPVDGAFVATDAMSEHQKSITGRLEAWWMTPSVYHWITRACSAALLNTSVMYFDVSGMYAGRGE